MRNSVSRADMRQVHWCVVPAPIFKSKAGTKKSPSTLWACMNTRWLSATTGVGARNSPMPHSESRCGKSSLLLERDSKDSYAQVTALISGRDQCLLEREGNTPSLLGTDTKQTQAKHWRDRKPTHDRFCTDKKQSSLSTGKEVGKLFISYTFFLVLPLLLIQDKAQLLWGDK